jgi:hypothetical protein
MPPTNGLNGIERICRLITMAATLWMLAVGLWEIAAPIGAGHAAVLAARGIIADNMVQYGIGFPVRTYTVSAPTAAAAYIHHPFGTYYLFTAMRFLFGRHEWALRLVPVLVSTAMPLLLYAVGRRLYGALAGAVAALGWAVLPIALAFAQFPSFELFSLAAMLCVTLAALRFEEERSRAAAALLLAVVALGLHTDWIVYLFVGQLLGVAVLVVAFGSSRGVEYAQLRRFVQVLALGTLVVAVTLAGYVASFHRAGLLGDWFNSAELRARGNEGDWREILLQRRYWIELMFTKPGIVLGLLGAVMMVGRLLSLRRFSDVYPLLLLTVATVHYVYFKNGSDVHIYWPLPFAAQFCFGLAILANSIETLGRWLGRWSRFALTETSASHVALGICAAEALVMLPDGLRALEYSRNSGCRLNDDGHLNLQDYDKNTALAFFKRTIPANAPVLTQSSMLPNWSHDWAFERPTATQDALGFSLLASPRYVMLDARFAMPTAAAWAVQSKTNMVGPFWLVDVEASPGELRVHGFDERPPSLLERLFVQAHDPVRRVIEDPYRTWEYRHHFARRPNPEPTGLDGNGLERILHNVLVVRGDLEGAAQVRSRIESTLDKRSARGFAGGLQLIGHRLIPGIVPRLQVFFVAAGAIGPDAFFRVRSRMLSAPRFSFVVRDDKLKEYGVGFEIHPSLWQNGMMYVSDVEVRPRPGRESFFGQWTGSQRPRVDTGVEEIPLFER